jgi:hypothetical protein
VYYGKREHIFWLLVNFQVETFVGRVFYVYQVWTTPKKIASVGAANQVFVVVAKYTGTAPTASASGNLAARSVTQIKVLVCLNHCISLGVFSYMKFEKAFVAFWKLYQ